MRKLIAIGLPVSALLIAASVAFGAVTADLEVIPRPNKASTKKKLRPITLEINVATNDPAATQPPPLKRVEIRFNKGGTFNGKLFPKCSFSKLQAQGPKACPKGSLIGSGSAVASAKPIIDRVNATVAVYNGQPKGGKPSVLLYNVPDISSPIVVQGTVEKRKAVSCAGGTGQCDYFLTFDVPLIPTLPNAPPASVLSVKTKTKNVFIKKKKRVNGKRRTVKIPYIGAPKECKGNWVADLNITFQDGATAGDQMALPCKK